MYTVTAPLHPDKQKKPVYQRSAPEIARNIKERYIEPAVEAEKERRKPLSKGQMMAQTIIGETKAHLTTQPWRRGAYQLLGTIDENKTYYIPEYLQPKGTPGYTPSYKVVSGKEFKGILRNQIKSGEKSYVEYMKNVRNLRTEVSEFPAGTTFTPTKTGFQPIVPEREKLRWGEQAYKQAESLPPGIQQISKISLGGWSSIWALSKPIADIFGEGKKFEQATSWFISKGFHQPLWGLGKGNIKQDYEKLEKAGRFGVHYPSLFDVAFERVGWSPKGSTKFLMKRPLFVAGGIGGELLQGVALTLPSEKIIQYSTKGVKGVITQLPKGIGKLNLSFPKFITKFGETTVLKNMYRWGAKGWKKGLQLVPGTHAPQRAITELGEEIFKKVPYASIKKVWLSPTSYEKAKLTLAKLLSKGGLDISFPTTKMVEGGKSVMGIVSHESYKLKGIWRKSLIETYWSAKFSQPIFKGTRLYWKGATSKLGGFSRKIGEKVWTGDTKILITKGTGKVPEKGKIPVSFLKTVNVEDTATIVWKDIDLKLKTPISIGKKTFVTTELKDVFIQPGTYSYGFKGKTGSTLIGLQSELPKKWLKRGTTRGIPGLLSIGELGETKTIYHPISTGTRGFGKRIPGTLTIPVITTVPLHPVGYGLSKISIGLLQQKTLPAQTQDRMSALGLSPIVLPLTTQLEKTSDLTLTATIGLTTQKQKQGLKDIVITKPTKPVFSSLPSMPKIPMIYLPQLAAYGRGRMFWDEELYGKKYKFRMFKLPSPLKGLKL